MRFKPRDYPRWDGRGRGMRGAFLASAAKEAELGNDGMSCMYTLKAMKIIDRTLLGSRATWVAHNFWVDNLAQDCEQCPAVEQCCLYHMNE